MPQILDAGVAVREDRRDDAAHEFLKRVPSAEPERDQVVAIDSPGERRRVARRGAGVFERRQETAVDRAWGVEGGEDLLLQEEGLICISITKYQFQRTTIRAVGTYSSSLAFPGASSSI